VGVQRSLLNAKRRIDTNEITKYKNKREMYETRVNQKGKSPKQRRPYSISEIEIKKREQSKDDPVIINHYEGVDAKCDNFLWGVPEVERA
jgi:hypothetical protein